MCNYPRGHRRWHIVWSVFWCCFTLLCSGISPAQAAASDQPDWAAIDRYVETVMHADRVPGAAVAIVHGDTIVHLKGFGVAGPQGQATTPQTPFLLGSMSKSFTALAIMQLVEAGKLDLDAPVQRYLPWFRVADPVASARISLRHLLHHTSGIPTNAPRAVAEQPTLEAHVRVLQTVQLNHAPGTVHEYASPNYQVLGAVIEAITHQSFGEYVQQHIFTPLDMRHSYVSYTAAQEQGMSHGYQLWFGYPVATDLPYEADRQPTASLIASVEDLARYEIAQLNGGQMGQVRILSADGIQDMHRPAAQGEEYSYAMGWRVGRINGVHAVHHGGVLPHFRGKMVLLPGERWGVVVLTNVSSFFGRPTSHDLADGIAAMLVGGTASTSTLSLSWLYLLLSIGLLLITVNQMKDVLLVRRWHQRVVPDLANNTRLFRRVVLPIALELSVPIALIIGLPYVVGFSLRTLFQQTPDLVSWLMLTAGLGFVVGLLKVVLVGRSLLRR